MTAIYCGGLSKSYGGVNYALEGLSLEVAEGSVFGFLGPNGAGKTTTVKLLTGLLTPSAGACRVHDVSPQENPSAAHALCGVLTETARLYGRLTGFDNLMFFGQVHGMTREESGERAEYLLKNLGLWQSKEKSASAYSTGMMQRLSFARALMHSPKVLFLDEPTSGLDPESAQSVNAMIRTLARQEGVTVFLCTHQLRYAQDLCDTYGLISKGKMLAYGNFQQLAQGIKTKLYAHVRVTSGRTGNTEMPDGWYKSEIGSEDEMPLLLQGLIQNGYNIYEAQIIRPTLEEIYFGYLGRNKEAQ